MLKTHLRTTNVRPGKLPKQKTNYVVKGVWWLYIHSDCHCFLKNVQYTCTYVNKQSTTVFLIIRLDIRVKCLACLERQ